MTDTTAQVVALAARRRRNPMPEVTCPCTPSWECFTCRTERLADRLRLVADLHTGVLLVTADALQEAVADALVVLDGITTEIHGRTTSTAPALASVTGLRTTDERSSK